MNYGGKNNEIFRNGSEIIIFCSRSNFKKFDYLLILRRDEDMYFNEIDEYVNMIYDLLESSAREYNRK